MADKKQRELIFFKFITFIARLRHNQLRAYCELKIFQSKYKNHTSLYFDLLSSVIGQALEIQIMAKASASASKAENANPENQNNNCNSSLSRTRLGV